ncbi:MAG: hypothetical protein K9W42_11610 [Candidatus Heimdallarchaeota archaeon]|nr:hypothetical protein [Candidatus Heimdallarchaeota archaeon]
MRQKQKKKEVRKNTGGIEEKQEPIELQEEEHKQLKLWEVLKLPWYELVLVILLVGATVAMFVLDRILPEGMLIGVVITSALLGLWLAFRPSEFAVDGLDNLMKYAGLTAYVAGVISSLASNLPEAVAAGILLVKGHAAGQQDLVNTAFYTTLSAAGFNAILLAIVILVGGKKKGYVEIKIETMRAENVLLRWGFVATFLTFAIAIIEILFQIFTEVKNQTFFAGIEHIHGELPRMAAAVLVVGYLVYLVYLIVKGRQAKALDHIIEKQTKPTRGPLDEKMPNTKELVEKTEPNILNTVTCDESDETYRQSGKGIDNPFLVAPALERPHVSLGAAIVLVILGIGGIAGGGYLLSHAIESLLEHTSINIGLAALLVGFSGSIPEHGIAVVAAAKGKTDVALGNIIGGILQMTLLVFGAFAMIIPAPIDYFMLFQIATIAVIIWFVLRSITDDHRLTSFEAIMIMLAQTFGFILLITELT